MHFYKFGFIEMVSKGSVVPAGSPVSLTLTDHFTVSFATAQGKSLVLIHFTSYSEL